MAFWKKFYKSKYTGAEIDAAIAKAGDATKVTANPTLAGTESALEGLQVGETKYKIPDEITKIYITNAKGNISCNYTYLQLASMLLDKTKTFDIMVNNQAGERISPVATYDNGANTISFFVLSTYLSTSIRLSIYTVTSADAWSLETKTIALT